MGAFDRLRRIAALFVVLAAAAAVLLAGAVQATAAAVTAQITAVASPAAVVYPGKAVIGGSLTGDAGASAGERLELFSRPAGASAQWAPSDTATTGADGAFSFPVAPSVSTEYQVRYPAGAAVPAATADVRVGVKPRVTVSFPAALWPGQTGLLRGAVTVSPAPPAGTTVALDRRVAGVWQPFAAASLDDSSRFVYRWAPADFGYYRLRARIDADADHDPGVSSARTVIVNRPNAHSVPMRYAHYIVIVRHEYRLYYYEHGVLVRRFNVALGRPGYRTPLGLFRIYGKRKPAGGALGACAMFYRRKGGIAIHGTDQPYLIRRRVPRAFSHGCARMLNRQALWLYSRVPVRTYVHNLP